MNGKIEMPARKSVPAPEALLQSCPSCDEVTLSDIMVVEKILLDEDGAYFEVEVPVVTCESCGFQFTDARAEKLRHDQACRNEGLLTSEEIADIRRSLGMTRAEFDAAFGIPPASMERWENARLIQNRSMDTLLRALRNPATADRLDRRVRAHPKGKTTNVLRFPTLSKSNRLGEVALLAEAFELRVGT